MTTALDSRTRCAPRCRCTRPMRTGRARRPGVRRARRRRAGAPDPGGSARRAGGRDGRPAPAPPDPDQRAAARERTPGLGHLHGTERLMLEAIEDTWAKVGGQRGRSGCAGGRGAASGWTCSRRTRSRAPSDPLGIDPARCVRVANGFDPDTFAAPRRPQGPLAARAGGGAARLGPGRAPVSVRYEEADPMPSATIAARRRCCSMSAATPG